MQLRSIAKLALVGLPLAAACTGGTGGATSEQGRQVAVQMGCTACHTADGNASVGPTWKGLWGKQERLSNGEPVTVDEGYIRESIVSPDAKVVQGFQPGIMPKDFGQRLSQQQIDAVIAYIKSLQ